MGNFNVKTNAGATLLTVNGSSKVVNVPNDLTVTKDLTITGDLGVNDISASGAINCNSLYANGNVSAASFTDRTPFFEGDAIEAVRNIKGVDGELDHTTLPEFVVVDSEYRDVGAMVSVLTVAVQQLVDIVEKQQLLIDELRKG